MCSTHLVVMDDRFLSENADYVMHVEVTVAMEGYMICNWVSNATLTAGYVIPSGDLLNDRFVKANQGTSTPFIALTPADEANELIQVLIK